MDIVGRSLTLITSGGDRVKVQVDGCALSYHKKKAALYVDS